MTKSGKQSSGAVAAVTAHVSSNPDLKGRTTGIKKVTLARSSLHDGLSHDSVEENSITRTRDPYIGCTVDGRYKLESVLGEGGMGVVYKCSHTIIGKQVAMKLLRADLARDQEVTERFLNEAKSASAIGNPHIIDISDFGQFPDGSTYFVMEYLDGEPLANLVEGGKLVPVERLLAITRQLAEGLSAAHRAGIVHRDLKPDNIFLVTRGQRKNFVKILDFGIAKVSKSADKLTQAGAVFGTPHYMSPEQAAGTTVDHRCDVYALGVIMYEMASGQLPFDADTFMGILTQHMYKSPPSLREVAKSEVALPPELEAIILKCLSKRAEERYQDMDSLIADLDLLSAGSAPAALAEMAARPDGIQLPENYYPGTSLLPVGPKVAASGFGRTRTQLLVGAGVAFFVLVLATVALVPRGASPEILELKNGLASKSAFAVKVTPPVAGEEPVFARQVLIVASPVEAHVFLGDKDLGSRGVIVEVKEGEKVSLEVRLKGYKSERLEVDGSEDKKVVVLEKTRRAGPAPKNGPKATSPNPPKTQPTVTDPTIVQPW